jgi:RimJ/RimL family protein N-acetyltransferase
MNNIQTERVIMRLFTMNDLDDLASILGNSQVMKYLEMKCQPLSREQTEKTIAAIIKHWETNGFGRWAVVCRESNKLIGMAGFRAHEDVAELVYILDEPYWGKGLATEIARAILKYGFEKHNFSRIVAMTRPANAASRRVMDKIGMTFEKEVEIYGISAVEYVISKEDFQALEK